MKSVNIKSFNCILLIVVLVLVIMCCMNKSKEGFSRRNCNYKRVCVNELPTQEWMKSLPLETQKVAYNFGKMDALDRCGGCPSGKYFCPFSTAETAEACLGQIKKENPDIYNHLYPTPVETVLLQTR